MKIHLNRFLSVLWHGGFRLHCGQYGEDVFLHKRYRQPVRGAFYVDVGAHHPCKLSNTAGLWVKGWNGVNIDASAAAMQAFGRVRPGDWNIHGAVVDSAFADQQPEVTFYFNRDIDNCATCDAALARERGLQQSVTVPALTLGRIIEQARQRFDGPFGLLNIDIEGLDERVIAEMGQWSCLPDVLMIELYGRTLREVLALPVTAIIESHGYALVERAGHTAIFERVVKSD